jgi:transitional endoplasmic reticulum ATPase
MPIGGFRVDVESTEVLGATVQLVEVPLLLASLDDARVRLVHETGLAEPVHEVTVDVVWLPAERPTLRLDAAIRCTPGDRAERRAILAEEYGKHAAPLAGAALLVGAVPLAAAVVGVTTVRARLRLASHVPAPPALEPVREALDAAGVPGGITATLEPAGDGAFACTLTAEVPADATAPAHVRAFVVATVATCGLLAGTGDPEPFAGRVIRVGDVAGAPALPAASAATGGGPTFDALGGIDDVVAELRTVATAFRAPEAMRRWGVRPARGVLLHGPPGTGKTTLAHALAHEIGGRVVEVRTPDILGKYLGSSERRIRDVFTRARRYGTPTVLFFDEIESIISYVGTPDGSGDQALNAVAGIFKQELTTLADANPNVVVVAATNFPERIDSSLIRPGRFDLVLEVPLPGPAARVDIWRKLLRVAAFRLERDGFRAFADDVDLDELALATAGMSGAGIEEALRRAQLAKALAESEGRPAPPIGQADLLRAVAGVHR